MTSKGFSLLELSIVMVIIGLLAGGVLSGRALINAAALNGTIKQADTYKSITYAFRDKYFALPGDMPNAVKFWGAIAGTLDDGVQLDCRDYDFGAVGTETCNGNGDGKIALAQGVLQEQHHERAHAWQHLANAGLLEGRFSGRYGIDTYAPATKLDNSASFNFVNLGVQTTSANFFAAVQGNALHLGRNASNTSTLGPFATPQAVWNMDVKLDDGTPDTGIVSALKGTGTLAPNCTLLNGTSGKWEYNLTNDAPLCSAIMIITN